MLKRIVFSCFMSAALLNVCVLTMANLPTPNITPTHHLNRIVAVVNEEVITQSEFDHAFMAAQQQFAQSGTPMPDATTFKKQVLDQLIYQKLQLQLAKRNNIKTTDTEVNDAIKRIAARNHITVEVLAQKLQEQNIPFDTFKSQISKQIILSKLQRQALNNTVTVSKAEVAAFRAQHANEINSTQYHLATILIPLPESPTDAQVAQAKTTAMAVLQQVHAQKNFEAVMAKYPGSSDLNWRSLNELPQLFAASIMKMQVGEIIGPIQAPNGFHILKLQNIRSKPGNLSNEQIQMILYQQKFSKMLRPWLEQLRKSAYVKVYITFS